MKYLLLLLSIFFLQSSLTVNAQNPKPDFQLDQFYPKWGVKNIESPADIQASAKVYSDGEKIHIEVEVVDDMLVNNADILHTDHVEVWFGIDSKVDREDKFWGRERQDKEIQLMGLPAYYYHWSKTKRDRQGLKLPTIVCLEKPTKKALIDNWEYINYKYFINNADIGGIDGNFKDLPITNNLEGVVHYGLFIDNRPTHFYDKEFYYIFEQSTGYQLADLSNWCHYTNTFTPNGYKINATFAIEALGFIEVPKMEELFLMIDVIDVDIEGKQETLLSSSSKRQWGNKFSFNKLKLKKPLQTNVLNIPSSFFSAKVDYEHEPQSEVELSGQMVYTTRAWQNYQKVNSITYSSWDEGAYIFYIDMIAYFPSVFTYHTTKIGKHTVQEVFSTSTDARLWVGTYSSHDFFDEQYQTIYKIDTLFLGSKKRFNTYDWQLDKLQQIFTFGDGSLGLVRYEITNHYKAGLYGACGELILQILKFENGKVEDMVSLQDLPCTPYHTYIHKYHYPNIEMERFVWQEVGKELKIITKDPSDWDLKSEELECYPSSIYITFNDDGTLQEIYPLPEKK